MSSPGASSDTSSLSPPPDTLSSPSPEPEDSRPPRSARGVRKPKTTAAPRKRQAKEKVPKITLKLKQQQSAKLATEKPKRQPKPREPKIETIPRSIVNNYDVPLVVLFRSKFRSLFSGTSELGPQDVEDGVAVDGHVSGKLEEFVLRICALIGNRRKNIEYLTPSILPSPVQWMFMSRRDQLEKVLQETVDSSFEKFGFRKDGVSISPLVNVTFSTLDWDGRVITS
jgi:hypothetical protein